MREWEVAYCNFGPMQPIALFCNVVGITMLGRVALTYKANSYSPIELRYNVFKDGDIVFANVSIGGTGDSHDLFDKKIAALAAQVWNDNKPTDTPSFPIDNIDNKKLSDLISANSG